MVIVSARDVGDDDGIIINSMDGVDSFAVGGSIATLVVSIDSMDVVDSFSVAGSITTLVVFIDSIDVADSLAVGIYCHPSSSVHRFFGCGRLACNRWQHMIICMHLRFLFHGDHPFHRGCRR